MTKVQRGVVHELARLYNVASVESGPEPRRQVVLLRNPSSSCPSARLSDAALAPQSTDAAAGHGPGGRPSSARPVVLTQVQCGESALAAILRPVVGDVHMRWDSISAGLPSATLYFESEGAAECARDALAGGRRGVFRVDQPHAMPSSSPASRDGAETSPAEGGAASRWHAALLRTSSTVAPWRGRSALLRYRLEAGLEDDSDSGRRVLEAPPQPREVLAPLRPRSGELTWDATRRVIWSSSDEEAALVRLQTMGFPARAGRLALHLAGEVDEDTRSAATSEWLLQHVEFVLCQESGRPSKALEAANPWSTGEGACVTSLPREASTIMEVDWLTAWGVDPTSIVLPRDFLEKQRRRWRREQRRRCIFTPLVWNAYAPPFGSIAMV